MFLRCARPFRKRSLFIASYESGERAVKERERRVNSRECHALSVRPDVSSGEWDPKGRECDEEPGERGWKTFPGRCESGVSLKKRNTVPKIIAQSPGVDLYERVEG
jgi:hypothetical protein